MVKRELVSRIVAAIGSGLALAQAGGGCGGMSVKAIDDGDGSSSGMTSMPASPATGGIAGIESGPDAQPIIACTTIGDYAGVENVSPRWSPSLSCSTMNERCLSRLEARAWLCPLDAGASGDAPERPDTSCPSASLLCHYDSTDGSCIVAGPRVIPDAAGDRCCYLVTFCGLKEGRPFFVDGRQRLPDVKRRGATDLEVACTLKPSERRVVGEAWLESARAEHASVAAFALLVLELLAVGAPAALVDEAVRAAGDEIRHARIAFDLASAFLGERVEAGPLASERPKPSADLADIAARAAWEGCVVETLGAALAREQALAADDPEMRAALESIAEDEARHAELSWKIVAWAVGRGDERVRHAVERALSSPLPPLDRVASTTLEELAPYGVLSNERTARVVEHGLRSVVEPARRALRAFSSRRQAPEVSLCGS
jgi:hypothetical protein